MRAAFARMEARDKANAEARAAEAARDRVDAIRLFPQAKQKERITELLRAFREDVLNERPSSGALSELQSVLVPLFSSQYADDPDVVRFRRDYEFWVNARDASAHRSDGGASSSGSVSTSAGTIFVGDSWDEALPKLNTGERLSFGFTGTDSTEEVRRINGRTYHFHFERHDGGPLRITRIDPE